MEVDIGDFDEESLEDFQEDQEEKMGVTTHSSYNNRNQ
jgi:hypothetical protein